MKTKISLFSMIILLFILTSSLTTNLLPSKGGLLPPIELPIPKTSNEKSYLGLSGSGFFKIPQIKARIVIIEIFSMYCPYCQKEAPRINEMYHAIENNPELRDRIKIIGLGAGNSPFEVEVFKKTYAVPFPLFSDRDFKIHKAYGEPRTPYFLVIKINDDGSHLIVHSQLGNFQGAETFLELVLKSSGLK